MEGKESKVLKIITTVIVLVLIIAAVVFVPGNDETMYFAQPEYISRGFDKNSVNQINVDIEDKDFEWLMENAINEEYKSCNITINGETFYNVAIRPKGNSSLNTIASSESQTKRYSFKINFGKYVQGQTYHGLSEMALNNIMSDKSYMKEYLSYELFDYMGVPSPVFAYSNIKINNKDWGLYLAVEIIDQDFVKRNFGTVKGNLYKPESMDMGGGFQKGFPGGENQKEFQQGGRFPRNQQKNEYQGSQGQISEERRMSHTDQLSKGEQTLQGKRMPQGVMPQGNRMPHGDGELNFQQSPQNQQAGRNDMPMPGGFGGMGARGGSNLKYIDDSQDSYNVIREGAIFDTTTDVEFKKVIEMIKNLNQGTDLEKYLDVDEILRFWAANTFLVNLDGYAGGMYHNYYLYEKDGKFTLIPWDLNMSFAGFGLNEETKVINFPIDSPVTGNLDDAPLIGKLLEVPQYKEKYHEYLNNIAQVYISGGIYEKSVQNVDGIIRDFVKNDATAFYSFEDYEKALPQMLTFAKDRAKSVLEQLDGTQPSDTYGNIQTTLDMSYLGSMEFGNFGRNRNDIGKNKNQENQTSEGMEGMAPPEGMEGMAPPEGMEGMVPPEGMEGMAPPEGMEGMAPPQGMKDVPFENMEEIMKIIMESSGQISFEQKEKLKELGVDENMFNMLGKMGKGPFIGNEKQQSWIGNTKVVILVLMSFLVLISGLFFVIRFKRKKYVVCKA